MTALTHQPQPAPPYTAPGADPVAVIGLSCRFPGAADPGAFWRNLVSAADSVGTAPPGRWEERVGPAPAEPRNPIRHGGFIEGIDEFDARFFGIVRREAEYMDPQQRLLLELSWQALEDAAVPAHSLRATRWGVYVGAGADDFRTQYFASGRLDRFGHMGSSRSLLAGRVSHHLGLRGPSEVVDTGQSSSLYALHRALASLRLGECDAALVAGVNLNLLPDVTDQVQLWGGLSADGRCRAFDERADGYVRAEGGGVVVLKPLEAAVRDGDHVYCVVRGSAANNDGGRTALGVPSPDAQREVIEAAHRAAGVTGASVGYVELHGTGTPVGDPVEAEALGEAIGRRRSRATPLLVGSVKSNIGHLESAAGIAGFIKACLVLHHGQLPPTLHHHRSPAELPLADLNLRVVGADQEERLGTDEVVGVSSFGMGGTNVHVVLAGSPARTDPSGRLGSRTPSERPTTDTVWCLSGRTREAARSLARAFLEHSFPTERYTVSDVAWSLAQRGEGEHRVAVVGGSWDEMRDGLLKIVAGHDLAIPADWLHEGGAERAAWVAVAGTYAAHGDLAKVADRLGTGRRKVPGLPTYPFERDTFHGPTPPHPVAPAPEPAPAAPEEARTRPLLDGWQQAADPSERLWLIRSFLERELLDVLGETGDEHLRVDPDSTFKDLGVDSMSLLELQDRLTAATAVELPESALFDHPTVNDLAAHLNTELEALRG
ncbi:phosphopantetheine-binding protein [Streptomyces sp. HP-A2021]|uniref:beta-ketoacyl synthase N-terminal-like domain-containing protein n=1 Tax=Streptomyces sp. HP-A2021 TaxID=2927875 RepID=UPI001FAF629F|nr:beta-ketoacyl synthase N-terminal-like domain-containing protein [Streptomyces sp. HP-A2021]UOB10488.1 phosphopantetheine-binding protein [Streptomyces sp. HP-A2021]